MNEELVEQGVVLNSHNGFLEIKLIENDNCDECSAKLFCNPKKDSSKTLTIPSNSKYDIGDRVTVSIMGKNLLGAAFNLYLYPLLLLISAIFLGSKIFTNNSEIYSFVLGIMIMAVYYGIFFQVSKKLEKKESKILISRSE